MRNWIRTAVICAVMAWCAEPLLAFDSSSMLIGDQTLGRCNVELRINASTKKNKDEATLVEYSAYVGVTPSGSRYDDWWTALSTTGITSLPRYLSGGSWWRRNSFDEYRTPEYSNDYLLTKAVIAACLEVSEDYITDFTQTGANADNFEELQSMGFGFTLTTEAGGLTKKHHQYYIGTVPSPPATQATAPTALVATAGNGQVSIAFTAPSNTGGAAISDYEYELDDSGTWTSASTATTPVVITGLTNGTDYSINYVL